jgi:hypothetical protein
MSAFAVQIDSGGVAQLREGVALGTDVTRDCCPTCAGGLLVAPVRACSDNSLVTVGGEQVYAVCAEGDTAEHTHWSERVKACVYYDCSESIPEAGQLIDQIYFTVSGCTAPGCDQDGDGNPDDPDPTPEPTIDPDTTVDCCGDPTDEYYEAVFTGFADEAGPCVDNSYGDHFISSGVAVVNGILRIPVSGGFSCLNIDHTVTNGVTFTYYADNTCATVIGTETLDIKISVSAVNSNTEWAATVYGDATPFRYIYQNTGFGDCTGGIGANEVTSPAPDFTPFFTGATVTVRKRAPFP